MGQPLAPAVNAKTPPFPPGTAPTPTPVAIGDSPSFRENIQTIWGLRSHFAIYLLPALGLLLLALVHADIALTATTAAQRVIDSFASPVAQPAPTSTTISERIFTTLAGDAGPVRLAFLLAFFLVLSQAMWIFIEQMRALVHEHFRHRLQSKLLSAFASELAPTRTRRSSANDAQIFTLDASRLSGFLIFQTVAAFENLAKLGVYTFGLARIERGWLIVAVALPITIVFQTVVARFYRRREGRTIKRNEQLNVEMRSQAGEFFDVLARLVYFRGERAHTERLLALSRASAGANRDFQLVSAIQAAVIGIVTTLSLPLVIGLLSLPVVIAAAGPDVSAGQIVQAQALLMLLTVSMSAMVGIPSSVAQAIPSVRRVEEVLRIPPPGDEPPALRSLRASQDAPALRVSDLTFQYAGTNQPILQRLSFEIPAGACVGVIGATASGKSTLARVLVGDQRPTAGRILYNDVDVTDWHLFWRRELIGFLPPDQGFVRGTLEENVLFGRSRESVRDYERALELSGVAVIARAKAAQGGMQMRIDSNVVETLSTGERRRIGIARLLLGSQRLWIFDEPGSGLDPRTMGAVASALAPGSAALRGKTTIIITHDPDVFRTEFNLFLEDGVIAAQAPHEELLQRSAAYAALVQRHSREREQRVSPA